METNPFRKSSIGSAGSLGKEPRTKSKDNGVKGLATEFSVNRARGDIEGFQLTI